MKGPAVIYPVVSSVFMGNCAALTIQDPADKTNTDNVELCIVGQATATLKIAPGLQPLPMSRSQAPVTVANDWDEKRTYFLNDSDISDPEMLAIYEADQKDREAGLKINWKVVGPADIARRTTTAKLLSDGRLHTGEDFERAAFVFQHGDTPDDYLLAHTLAMIAVAAAKAAPSGSPPRLSTATCSRSKSRRSTAPNSPPTPENQPPRTRMTGS